MTDTIVSMPDHPMPDLDQFAPLDTAVMEVRDPVSGETLTDPDGTPWTIELYGPESDQARQFSANLDRSRRQKRSKEWSIEELRKVALDRMTALTKSWHLRRSGEGVPCDAKTVRAVYTKWPWLMKQAADFANEEANFLGESQAS